MESCIFCQIILGKLPSYKIYEDELFYGLLDIFPVSKGHALLIPKIHYRWVHDVPEFGKYWEAALKIANSIQKTVSPKWVQYFTHGVITHAHIHILPRYDEIENSRFIPTEGHYEKFTKNEMNQIAESIKKSL